MCYDQTLDSQGHSLFCGIDLMQRSSLLTLTPSPVLPFSPAECKLLILYHLFLTVNNMDISMSINNWIQLWMKLPFDMYPPWCQRDVLVLWIQDLRTISALSNDRQRLRRRCTFLAKHQKKTTTSEQQSTGAQPIRFSKCLAHGLCTAHTFLSRSLVAYHYIYLPCQFHCHTIFVCT